MPMPDYLNNGTYPNIIYGANYSEVSPDYCLPLNPVAGAFVPRAYVIDQPYQGILPYAEGFKRGNIFPNLILPSKQY